MNFLSNVLREEGGFEYKKTIVDCILCLVKSIPDATEAGLTHLSEFIEDCEFTYLSLKYFTFSASSVHLQQIQASTYDTFTIVSFWKMRLFEPRQSVRWQILVPAQLPYGLES